MRLSSARPGRQPAAGRSGDAASTRERFRPDLEGLRAVAVVLVLLFHAGIPGFGGGFIGVDVFFVLSGFLITGLIVRELAETGRVSLPAFYARRARRLLPAALLVIAVTVIASIWLLPPLRVPDVATDAASAALYASNVRFALQSTDYLQSDVPPSPLLHYWSLGVEEQFYVVWPALLALAAGLARGRTRPIALVIAAVTVASLGLSIVLTGVAAPWAFFSLPTRAWELGLGALLAVSVARLAGLPRVAREAACAAGIGLIVLAAVVIGTDTPFPGLAALLPTAGAALVIAAGVGAGPTRTAGLLALGPARFLGRISYSLYLWHWPILVIPAAALESDLALPARVGLAVLAIPVAAASQRWVEEPIHRGRLLERLVGRRPGRSLALAGALSLTVALVSVGAGAAFGLTSSSPVTPLSANLDANEGLLATGSAAPTNSSGATGPAASSDLQASPPPHASAPTTPPTASHGPVAAPTPRPATPRLPVPANVIPPLARATADNPVIYSDGCHLGFLQTKPETCVYGDAASRTTIVLFGDSHAAQWFPALEQLANADHLRLVSLTKSACSAADVRVWNSSLKRAYTECDTWRNNVIERIADEHPALVVIAEDRLYQLVIGGAPVAVGQQMATWNKGLARTLERVRANAAAVALVGETPRSDVDPPVCLSAHLSDALACATPMSEAIDPAWTAAERASALAAGARFVDTAPLVCPSDPCPAVIGRVLVYRDQHHLTATFSAVLARRLGLALQFPPG